MLRQKKAIRSDGRYEYKATVGRTLDGKPIRKSFYSGKSLADAKAKAEAYKIEAEVAARTGDITPSSEMNFAIWARKWLTVYKKPNVAPITYDDTYLNTVEKHLIPYFGAARLTDIKQIDVQKFFSEKGHTCSESLLHKMRLCLNGIFETAIENDICYKNPTKHTVYKSDVPKNEKKVYTDGQLVKAREYFKTDMPEVFALLETGLRRGELLGLMFKDIDFQKLTLRVERSAADKKGGIVELRPPKWNSYRTIPISSELAELLGAIPRSSIYVFPSEKGGLQSPRSWSQKLERHMKKFTKQCLCMPELTAHELRHTRGTELRRNGVDIYTIQKLLGHKDINVTAQIYVHDDVETTRTMAKII